MVVRACRLLKQSAGPLVLYAMSLYINDIRQARERPKSLTRSKD